MLRMRKAYKVRASGDRGEAVGISSQYIDSTGLTIGQKIDQYQQGNALILVPQGVDPFAELLPALVEIAEGKTQVDPSMALRALEAHAAAEAQP